MSDVQDSNSKIVNKNEAIEEICDWIESILFSVFAVVLIFTFILRPANVIGTSMVPTLQENDKLIVSKLLYSPKIGDVVAINSEVLNEAIVKRVIATEGQEVNIDFEAGKVFINGEEQYEPYINEATKLDEGAFKYPVIVPKDCIFVMGDNRNWSLDSRDPKVGFVSTKDVLGKVIFRVYPFSSFGTVD